MTMNSNENPSPLPQPMRNTCPKCGNGWNENTPFCPQCGASLTPPIKQKASAGTQILFGCGFIVLGGMGACFSMLGLSEGFSTSALNPAMLVGAAMIGCALFLLWKLVRGGR